MERTSNFIQRVIAYGRMSGFLDRDGLAVLLACILVSGFSHEFAVHITPGEQRSSAACSSHRRQLAGDARAEAQVKSGGSSRAVFYAAGFLRACYRRMFLFAVSVRPLLKSSRLQSIASPEHQC
jgi:hypothetical protein